jgi:hypothetical protein
MGPYFNCRYADMAIWISDAQKTLLKGKLITILSLKMRNLHARFGFILALGNYILYILCDLY